MWPFPGTVAIVPGSGKPEVMPLGWQIAADKRCWSQDRGEDHAFRRGTGGRFQWRKADANEPRGQF